MQHASSAQSEPIGATCQRPERQLNDIVIELRCSEREIVQPIDNKDRDQRSEPAHQLLRHGPHCRKGGNHRNLSEQIVEQVGSEQAVADLDQPPWQRRQLVIADLPFASVGQGLDQIERQVEKKRCRERSPYRDVQGQECRKDRGRPLLDNFDEMVHCGWPLLGGVSIAARWCKQGARKRVIFGHQSAATLLHLCFTAPQLYGTSASGGNASGSRPSTARARRQSSSMPRTRSSTLANLSSCLIQPR